MARWHSGLLVAQVLKLLSLEEVQVKITRIFGESEPRGVGHEYRGILTTFLHIIYHHIVKHTRVAVLVLHI